MAVFRTFRSANTEIFERLRYWLSNSKFFKYIKKILCLPYNISCPSKHIRYIYARKMMCNLSALHLCQCLMNISKKNIKLSFFYLVNNLLTYFLGSQKVRHPTLRVKYHKKTDSNVAAMVITKNKIYYNATIIDYYKNLAIGNVPTLSKSINSCVVSTEYPLFVSCLFDLSFFNFILRHKIFFRLKGKSSKSAHRRSAELQRNSTNTLDAFNCLAASLIEPRFSSISIIYVLSHILTNKT